MDWKAELFKRLDALADKLGVAAGHLWAVLVRQAYVEGMFYTAVSAALLVGVALCLYWIRWYSKQPEKYEREYSQYNEYGPNEKFKTTTRFERYGWVPITSTLVGLALTGFAFDAAIAAITGISNPEYAALQKIMEMLK